MLPVLTALNSIAAIDEETYLLDANSQGLVKALVHLLEDENRGDASVLQLSSNRLHVEVLISFGILDEITRILLSPAYYPDYLKKSLVPMLKSICNCTGRQEMTVLKNPGTLALVVKVLVNDDKYFLQLTATWTLCRLYSNITCGRDEAPNHLISWGNGTADQLSVQGYAP